MERVKTKKSFNDIIETLTYNLIDEMTTTGDIEGYETPFFLQGSKGKKKKKKISTNSTGYDIVNEVLDDKDLKQITKLIRNVVGDILRDIWLKRTAWK